MKKWKRESRGRTSERKKEKEKRTKEKKGDARGRRRAGSSFPFFLISLLLRSSRLPSFLPVFRVPMLPRRGETKEEPPIENVAAPKIAIDYWGLPADATLRDVVLVVRADEADHRLLNHHLSNRFDETKAARAADGSVSPYEHLGDVDLQSILGPTVVQGEKAKAAAASK